MNAGNNNKSDIRSSTKTSAAAATTVVSIHPNNDTKTTQQQQQEPATTTTTTSPPNTPTIFQRIKQFRNSVGYVVNHPYVQGMIISLIAINAIMLGIATYDFVQNSEQIYTIFETIDFVFLIIFTIELCAQFIYLGLIPLLQDPWLVFDVLLIGSSWIFQDLTIIRSFRIFRTLRLISRISVMRNLIVALFSVVPRMIAILVLLMLISYIFAVMMTQLFQNLYNTSTSTSTGNDTTFLESDTINYFGRLDYTYLTLFQIMTLDNWSEVSNDVTNTYSWGWLPIIVYMIIAGFIIFNLIIAVVCDAISALQEDTKAKLHGTYDKDKEYNNNNNNVHDHSHTNTDHDMKGAVQLIQPTLVANDSDLHPNRVGTTNTIATGVGENTLIRRRKQQHQQGIENIDNDVSVVVNRDTTDAIGSRNYYYNDTTQFENMNEQLRILQQQMTEVIQIQDQSIQRVISITQQYQSIRCNNSSATAS